jgi:signal peptidase II
VPDTESGGGGDLQDTAVQADHPTDLAPRPARAARPRWALFLVLAALVLVVDQLTKAWIVANVDPARPLPVFGDLVRLVFSRNTGALFGLFRDNATLFAVVSVGVIAAIAWYHARSPRSAPLSVALGLLLGGAVGNLVDRLRLGYVVDFVDAGIGGLRFYTFNVADSAITGALLLILLLAVWPSLGGEAPSTAPDRDSSRDAGG